MAEGAGGAHAFPPSPASTTGQRSQARRYGFACSNCRRRKTRCDGAFPTCQKCIGAHETCRYDRRPSVAFAVSLQHRLKAYQERLEELQHVRDDERDALLAKPIADAADLRGGKARALSAPRTPPNDIMNEGPGSFVAPAGEGDNDGVVEETSIGSDGQVHFYGKTSLYHIDSGEIHQQQDATQIRPESTSPVGSSIDPSSRHAEREEMRLYLSEIDPTVLGALLDTYWCWPHHLHLVLCKKVFLRDLHTLGPCISPFLLSAVLTQAARYSIRPDAVELGEHFAKRGLQLLIKDIDRGSSIPAIQGLLIFSARECGCGRNSQGWLYSGMAIRMARDLGMHVAPKKLGSLSSQFSDEELALRQQLFWSCYTWDKTMSLCFGRAPIVNETIELPTPETLLDGKEADDEIWQPVLAQGSSLSRNFVQHRSLSSTRFAAYCELCIIINGVLDKLYSRPHRAEKDHMLAYLTQTLEKLDEWSSRLPAELLVSENTKAAVLCPPLHILIINLLYNTTAILLCRPYRKASATARKRCTRAAQMTDVLFTLHVRRFGFRCITWLQTYTMFVACTINVCDVREPQSRDASLNQEANARLDFGLEVLRQTGSTPSATRCALIIEQLLQAPSPPDTNRRGTLALTPQRTSSSSIEKRNNKTAPSSATSKGSSRQTVLPISNAGSRGLQVGTNPTHDLNSATFHSSSSMALPEHSLAALNAGWAGAGIDTPFRWLPDNVYHDPSWMLMDIDFDSWPYSSQAAEQMPTYTCS